MVQAHTAHNLIGTNVSNKSEWTTERSTLSYVVEKDKCRQQQKSWRILSNPSRTGSTVSVYNTIQHNTVMYCTHTYRYVWATVASTGVCLFIRGNCVNIEKIHFYSIFVHIPCRCVFLSTGRFKTFVQTMAHCHVVDTYPQRDITYTAHTKTVIKADSCTFIIHIWFENNLANYDQ